MLRLRSGVRQPLRSSMGICASVPLRRRRRCFRFARRLAMLDSELFDEGVEHDLFVVARHCGKLDRYVNVVPRTHDLNRATRGAFTAFGTLVFEEHVAELLVLLGDLESEIDADETHRGSERLLVG